MARVARGWRWRAAAWIAAALGSACALASSSAQPLDVAQLARLADSVVVGTVTSTESRWEGSVIVTVAHLAIAESLKGTAEGEMEITQLGGSAVHPRTGIAMTMTASTQVELRSGDEVVAFVTGAPGRARQLVGAQQGVLAIRANPRTGVKEVPVGPKELAADRRAGQPTLSTEVMTLEGLRRHILDAARHSGGAR